MPKRQGEVQVKPLKEEDMKYWAEQLLYFSEDEEDERRTEQLAHRVLNLADVTSLIDYLTRVNGQEIYQTMIKQSQDIGVLKQIIINELEVPVEKLEEYENEYTKQLEASQKAMELLSEIQESGEDVTPERLEEIIEEYKDLTGTELDVENK